MMNVFLHISFKSPVSILKWILIRPVWGCLSAKMMKPLQQPVISKKHLFFTSNSQIIQNSA